MKKHGVRALALRARINSTNLARAFRPFAEHIQEFDQNFYLRETKSATEAVTAVLISFRCADLLRFSLVRQAASIFQRARCFIYLLGKGSGANGDKESEAEDEHKGEPFSVRCARNANDIPVTLNLRETNVYDEISYILTASDASIFRRSASRWQRFFSVRMRFNRANHLILSLARARYLGGLCILSYDIGSGQEPTLKLGRHDPGISIFTLRLKIRTNPNAIRCITWEKSPAG